MTFLINLNNWAISVECEDWVQAQECADDIGGELLGEKQSEFEWLDIDLRLQ